MQRVQNKAIKNLYSLHFRTSTNYIHENYKLLPITYLFKEKTSRIIHKVMNKQMHTNSNPLLNSQIHNHNTKTSKNIYNSNRKPNSITSLSIHNYNCLPNFLKQQSTLNFNKKLKAHIFDIFKGNT